jgi:hypothetical protein
MAYAWHSERMQDIAARLDTNLIRGLSELLKCKILLCIAIHINCYSSALCYLAFEN